MFFSIAPSFKIGSSEIFPEKKYANRSPLANVVAINKNAVNPERALMFCEMVNTNQEFYDMLQYGIVGKTYVLDGNIANYPQGMDTTSSNYMEWGGQWAFWKPQYMRPNPTYSENFWQKETDFASRPMLLKQKKRNKGIYDLNKEAGYESHEGK